MPSKKHLPLQLLVVVLFVQIKALSQEQLTNSLNQIIQSAGNNPTAAIDALDSLKNTISHPTPDENAKIYQAFGIVSHMQGKPVLSLDYFQQAVNQKGIKDAVLEGGLWNNMGVVSVELGNYDSALTYYNKALQIRRQTGDIVYGARTLMNIANVYNRKGMYVTATEYYYQALPIFEERNLTLEEATIFINIGSCQQKRLEYEKAKENFFKAYSLFQQINDTIGQIAALNNIGSVEMDLHQFDVSKNTFQTMLNVSKACNDSLDLGFALKNLGQITLYEQNWEQAKVYFQQATMIFQRFGYKVDLLETKGLLAEVRFNQGYRNEALAQLKQIYQQLVELKQTPLIVTIGEKYARYLFLYGRYRESSELYQEISALQNEAYSVQKKLIAEDIEGRYRFEKQEKELLIGRKKQEVLETENELQQQKFRFYLMGLIMLIVLLLFGTLFLRYRYKQKNRLVMQAKQISEAEKENVALKNKNLQQELLNKNSELSRFAMHISENKRFLKDLATSIKKARNPEQINQVYIRIIQNMQSDKVSEELYAEVDELLSGFRTALKDRYPNLTDKDMRLCSLLKLALSSKDIASIFNISAKSVDMHRYRLRKKMNIPKSVSIENWLQEIHASL